MQHIDLCLVDGIKGQLMNSFHSRFRILSIHQYALFIVDRYFTHKISRTRRKNTTGFFHQQLCAAFSAVRSWWHCSSFPTALCSATFFYRYWHEERLSKMWIEQST